MSNIHVALNPNYALYTMWTRQTDKRSLYSVYSCPGDFFSLYSRSWSLDLTLGIITSMIDRIYLHTTVQTGLSNKEQLADATAATETNTDSSLVYLFYLFFLFFVFFFTIDNNWPFYQYTNIFISADFYPEKSAMIKICFIELLFFFNY